MDTISDDAVDLTQPVETQPVLTQERVNEIVKREKAAAAAKAKKEALLELESQRQSSMGGMDMPNVDQMYDTFKDKMLKELQEQQRLADEEARKREVQEMAQRFFTGMSKGKEFAPDFDAVTGKINLDQLPNLITLIAEREDLAPLMYEFANNPQVAAELNDLVLLSPDYVMNKIDSIANSIRANQEALENKPKVNAPLSTVKPSISTGAGGDEPSMSDLKRKYKF
jgi:hypothetical protein